VALLPEVAVAPRAEQAVPEVAADSPGFLFDIRPMAEAQAREWEQEAAEEARPRRR